MERVSGEIDGRRVLNPIYARTVLKEFIKKYVDEQEKENCVD